ncbi:MAG: exonuclease SbcC [Marine Group I thaumarchaeote]|nr:MAG: exonuclease SbcC [Marine Group I thaumarchaeote]
MVFGWGKKKEKSQEIETLPLEKQISLSEVNKITNEIKSLREKTLISDYKSFKNKIDDQLIELIRIAKQLEKDNLKTEDIDKHLRTIVMRGKRQVITTINKEATVDFNKINSYDDVLKLDKEISQVLKKIGDVLGRQTRVIHIFAKKYAAKLKNILFTLDADAKELHTILKNYRNFEENILSISDNLTQINKINVEQQTGEKRLIELNDQKGSLIKKIESAQQEIEKLKDSKEYSKFHEIQDSINNLQSEKSRISSDIDQQFTKISRPLTKYGYVSSLDKPMKILMGKLLQNPFDVLTPENKANIITILQSARKGVQSGFVSVKDMEKSLIQIDETTEILDNFINRISEFNSKKQKLQSELKIFNISELEKKQSELSKAKSDQDDLENKIHIFENEISESKTKIPNIIKDIEGRLREISSTKYTINQ